MNQLWTKWGKNIDKNRVLPEYPREQMKRENWINLNGEWDYAFCKAPEKNDADLQAMTNTSIPDRWEGKILVPFSPETVLSGVERQLQPDEYLWYRRELTEFQSWERTNTHVILHFGAVDQSCTIYVNGKAACTHMGGYLPFDVDITEFLYDRNELGNCAESSDSGNCKKEEKMPVNELVVQVRDVSDTSYHARGKQKLKRGGMYYTAVSGIWQTAWIEEVPENYIRELEIHPDPETGFVELTVHAEKDAAIRIFVHTPEVYLGDEMTRVDDEAIMQRVFFSGTSNHPIRMRIPSIRKWSCETPWLYHLDVQMGEDMVSSYFAFRTIFLSQDEKGIARIYVNGEETCLKGVLDQGYWPESLMTPPSDDAMIFDLTEMKKFGFNMVRKHAKVEPDRWYYHCDRIGLLVWQDVVNGGEKYKDWYITYAATGLNWAQIKMKDNTSRLLSRQSEAGKEEFRREITDTANALKSHPSIMAWTIFNEAWGQFETAACTDIMRKADPERLIDSASGWFDQGCGDFRSIHYYYLSFKVRPEKDRAFIISEFGGLPMYVAEHSASGKVYGYGTRYKTNDDLKKAYDALDDRMTREISNGLCATVYTQWTDIEDEVNGIYTWDREIFKMRAEDSLVIDDVTDTADDSDIFKDIDSEMISDVDVIEKSNSDIIFDEILEADSETASDTVVDSASKSPQT